MPAAAILRKEGIIEEGHVPLATLLAQTQSSCLEPAPKGPYPCHSVFVDWRLPMGPRTQKQESYGCRVFVAQPRAQLLHRKIPHFKGFCGFVAAYALEEGLRQRKGSKQLFPAKALFAEHIGAVVQNDAMNASTTALEPMAMEQPKSDITTVGTSTS